MTSALGEARGVFTTKADESNNKLREFDNDKGVGRGSKIQKNLSHM